MKKLITLSMLVMGLMAYSQTPFPNGLRLPNASEKEPTTDSIRIITMDEYGVVNGWVTRNSLGNGGSGGTTPTLSEVLAEGNIADRDIEFTNQTLPPNSIGSIGAPSMIFHSSISLKRTIDNFNLEISPELWAINFNDGENNFTDVLQYGSRGFRMNSNDPSNFQGLVGSSYFGANYDDNTYVQKKYVDDAINDLEIPEKTSELINDSGFITTETDPTIPSWAKQPNKPDYSWSEIQSKPSFNTVATSGDYNDLINTPEPAVLIKVTELGNTGYRLAKQLDTPENFGDIGDFAIDLTQNSTTPGNFGATGEASLAIGVLNTSSGAYSTTIGGAYLTASGPYSSVFGGYGNSATKAQATVIGGSKNTAEGNNSLVGGVENTASSLREVVLGSYATIVAGNPTTFIGTDRLFTIGNGTSVARSDALTILKNGLATLPSVTNTLIDAEPTGKAIVTKEWVKGAIDDLEIPEQLTAGEGIKIDEDEISVKPATSSELGGVKIWKGTKEEYAALGTYDNNTLYYIETTPVKDRVVLPLTTKGGITLPAMPSESPVSFVPIALFDTCPAVDPDYIDWEITWKVGGVMYKASALGDYNLQLSWSAGSCFQLSGQTMSTGSYDIVGGTSTDAKLILYY